MDRSFVCDFAYSHALGRLGAMSLTDVGDWQATIEALDRTYGLMDALLVICTRSSYEGRQDPGWQLMDGKMMATLDDLYRRYMITTHMRRLVLNVDDEDTDRQVNDIIQKLDNPWER